MGKRLKITQRYSALVAGACCLLGLLPVRAEPLMPLLAAASTAPAAVARPAARAPRAARAEEVTLNFVNADIESVVRAVGQFLKKDILVDPRVKGTVTIVTDQPVGRDEAWRQLLAALRFQGFTVVDSAGFSKVVPEADAKFLGGPTIIGGSQPAGDQLVTQIFRLNHESANALLPMVRPLVSANNPVSANPSNNTLVITDYAENLRRIARIIAAVDLPAGGDPEVVSLQYALAVDLAGVVARLLDPVAGANVDPGQRVIVMAEPRTNALLLRAASPARLAYARSLIARLDLPTSTAGNIHVVQLKNANAAQLAQTLRAVLSGDLSQTSPGGQGGGAQGLGGIPGTLGAAARAASASQGNAANPLGQSNAGTSGLAAGALGAAANPFSSGTVSGAGAVQADVATNSLIITAPEPVYRNLRAIIELLDARRAQVFVESLIVEVTADKAAEFGIQWQDLSGAGRGGSQLIGGTNFGGAGRNIINASANLGTLGNGLNIGVVRGTITLPGIGTVTNLGFLARALEADANANILSTPNLLTLDNEEAQIVVGQNVPFITGQYAQTGTTATVTPFQTIERRDVGLTLRVRPQVSQGGTVKLQIYQEVSSVQDNTIAAGVITNKRSIESSVLVDDGQIIVLGGLVQDSVTDTRDKVPGLGDLPLIGGLFRYDTRKRSKTNLMVFLRPYVLRTAADSNSILPDRYEAMRREEIGRQLPSSVLLPDLPGPVLPALLPAVPPAVPPVTPAAPAR